MANRERGEIEVLIDGTQYTLRLTTNGLCALEARTGRTFLDLLKELDAFSLRVLREVLLQALQEYHAAEFPTVESVGDFIDRLGGMMVAVAKVQELFEVNQPRDAGGTATNPLLPTGTGDVSSLRAVG